MMKCTATLRYSTVPFLLQTYPYLGIGTTRKVGLGLTVELVDRLP